MLVTCLRYAGEELGTQAVLTFVTSIGRCVSAALESRKHQTCALQGTTCPSSVL